MKGTTVIQSQDTFGRKSSMGEGKALELLFNGVL